MAEKEISKAVISRLPRYYRYLGELLEDGVERISSNELSQKMKVTASQIRQDLNNFGGFGQQGYGYNVKYLYTEIAKILGIDRQHNLIIIGAGNLGQAIANYANFEKRGFVIKGMFDINPRLIGLVVRGIEIRGVDDLEQFIVDNNVQIAALTIPKMKAPEIADRLVKAGVKAIWNFAHVDLNTPEDVVVENVHLVRESDALILPRKQHAGPEKWSSEKTMIIGVGTDMVEIQRVEKAVKKEAFLARVYTEEERRQAGENVSRLAGSFAVKEAVAKVLGTGFRTFYPKEIEVLRNPLGKPYVRLHNNAEKCREEAGITRIEVSITNTGQYALAFAVGEGEEK